MDWTIILWIAAFGLIIYFLMIRPNKKRQEEQKKLMDAMQPGTRVMLTSGIFGTIQATGDKQMVIELAPGVAITVVRQAIAKALTPEEEEFEYADDDAIEPADKPLEVTDGSEELSEDMFKVPDDASELVGDDPAPDAKPADESGDEDQESTK